MLHGKIYSDLANFIVGKNVSIKLIDFAFEYNVHGFIQAAFIQLMDDPTNDKLEENVLFHANCLNDVYKKKSRIYFNYAKKIIVDAKDYDCSPYFLVETKNFRFPYSIESLIAEKNEVPFIFDELSRAFCLFDCLPENIRGLLARNLRFIVPYYRIGNNQFNSSSFEFLPGVIFISRTDNFLQTAENIIHESAHLELFVEEQVKGKLFLEDYQSYAANSPWRNDKRPLIGIFHGCFVFSYVYQFYKNLINEIDKTDELNLSSEFIDKRMIVEKQNIEIALKEVPIEFLSIHGKSIYEGILSRSDLK